MLESCFEHRCHKIRTRRPGPSPSAGSSTGGVRMKRARPPPGDVADNDDDDDDDDGNASRITEDSGVAEIARGVGAMGQKSKSSVRRTKQTARKSTLSLAAAATAAMETPARARVRVKAPRAGESDAESSKAGSVRAPPASAPGLGTPASISSPAPASAARKRRPATKPRRTVSPTRKPVSAAKPPSTPAPASTAAATSNSPPNSSPGLRGRKPRSPFKMDSVEIVVRSRSATRSRVRGSGGETADEKMMTDAEGKVRKRRKLAGAGAA